VIFAANGCAAARCIVLDLQEAPPTVSCAATEAAGPTDHVYRKGGFMTVELESGLLLKKRIWLELTEIATNMQCRNTGAAYSYDAAFARQRRGIGRRGDLLVGLSTGGNSANIIRLLKQPASALSRWC
jgi:hypothetical protein